MTTIDDIERQIFNADNRLEIESILRQWAEEIIDECIYKAEAMEIEGYIVVEASSIIRVKEQL